MSNELYIYLYLDIFLAMMECHHLLLTAMVFLCVLPFVFIVRVIVVTPTVMVMSSLLLLLPFMTTTVVFVMFLLPSTTAAVRRQSTSTS